jgi:hypothetical protein
MPQLRSAVPRTQGRGTDETLGYRGRSTLVPSVLPDSSPARAGLTPTDKETEDG